MKCPNCNESNHEPNAVYCHNCGAYLLKKSTPKNDNDHPQPSPTPQPNVNTHSTVGGDVWKWLVGVVIAIVAIFFFMRLNSESPKESNPTEVSPTKVIEVYPNDLSGNYLARKIYGDDNINATVKVYRDGGNYAMNVYSSSITRKIVFSYNPSTGEIMSEELGKGKAMVKELTNETKITFEGWELVK